MIPQNAIEIQTGLYLHEDKYRKLYAGDGYCFWSKSIKENYDKNGNLRSEEERVYYKYMSLASSMSGWTYEQLNNEFIAGPIKENYRIC